MTVIITTAIIGVIENPRLSIGGVDVRIKLRVIKANRSLLLLGIDWYKKYQARENTIILNRVFKNKETSKVQITFGIVKLRLEKNHVSF